MLDENNMSREDRPNNSSHLVKAKIANYLREVEDSRKGKSQALNCKKVSWVADKNIYTCKLNSKMAI